MSEISSYFRSKIELANRHQRRLDKLSDIVRDKQIDSDLRKRFDKSDDPRVKTSLYFKLYRTFEIQSELLPSTRPVSEKWGPAELAVVSSLKDTIYSDGQYGDLYQTIVNDRMRTDGATFVEIGYAYDGKYIKPKAHQFANVFTDYDADYLATDERDCGEEFAKWIAFRVRMHKNKAKKNYGIDIRPGDFLNDTIYGAENKTKGGQAALNDPDMVSIYYCYSIEDEPKYCVMGGADGEIIDEAAGKENYMRYIKRANGYEYAFLPAVDFHFTRAGSQGLCTMSMIGVMADIANSDQRINDVALPALKKVVNKIVAVFGQQGAGLDGVDERVREEILMGLERQSLGINPVIAIPGGTSMQTISPDAGVINEFIAIQNKMMDFANTRFDIDFVRLANDDVKATVFVGKTKAELQAISSVYKINRRAFNRMAEYSVALARFWRLDEGREAKVPIDDETGYSINLPLSEILLTIEEWDGTFETDVDLRMPLSTSDKSQAIVDLETQKQNIFYGKPFSSVAEIVDEIDMLVQRANMAGLEELYKKPVLIKKAQAILAGRNQAAVGQQMPQSPGSKAGMDNVNKDVAAELAPQTALAESGMAVR